MIAQHIELQALKDHGNNDPGWMPKKDPCREVSLVVFFSLKFIELYLLANMQLMDRTQITTTIHFVNALIQSNEEHAEKQERPSNSSCDRTTKTGPPHATAMWRGQV